MATDVPSYSKVDEGYDPKSNKATVSYAAGKSEIIYRIFGAIIPMFALIILSVCLGFNNSSAANDLSDIENCNATINALDPASLRRSVNIFGGIWVAVSSLAIIYQIVLCIIRSLNLDCINNNFKTFITVDIVISHFLTYFFIGGIVGSYLLGNLWGAYNGAIDGDSVAGAIAGTMFGAFGVFIGTTSFYLNFVINMTVCSYKNRNCENKECNKNNCNLKTTN